MKKMKQIISHVVNTRLGFILTLLVLYWLKTMWAYHVDFSLGLENPYQLLLSIINPIPLGLLLLGLSLYIKRTRVFYIVSWIIYTILNLLLISNAIYFREFSDFITVSAMLASSKVSAGLGDSALNLLRVWDIIYIIDYIVLLALFATKKIKVDNRPFNKRASFAITALSTLFFSINLFMAEIDRPELLTRGFSNVYVVRALGLPSFTAYSANQTYQTEKVRSEATASDLKEAKKYVSEHYAAPNSKYFGIAKGRNVIVIHLESFQQFLIDYHLQVDGKSYEVTPFLNSLYHSNSTLAFSNFFNQVKAGKTSDAETLMETSLFGLSSGSYLVNYGGTNTAYAAPSILGQTDDYTSAVFHGNVGTFWNRNNAYKQWGYNYFFDSSYFTKQNSENSFQYGLNDKYMFADSIKYLEHMQQPFYTKFITVSNHYPYTSLAGNSDEEGFPLAKTNDETINGYFATANYLDSAIKAFFDYLKESGLYDNSIIVLYGDHYGISNSRNTDLAPLLGKDSETWTGYDNAMLQRVPYMIHIPGFTEGHISNTFGGEVDNLPTLLHLLGIDTSNYVQLGQDLLSSDNKQIVAFRTSGDYVTPTYTSYSGHLYYTDSGQEITNPDENTQAATKAIRDAVAKQLSVSDEVQTGDLLRFDKNGLKEVDSSSISYTHSLKTLKSIEKKRGDESTSLYSENGDESTVDLFKAPSYMQLHESSNSSSSE
ncbi:polyglycerol phosphate synthase [Streptococcus infantarius subsp. infantarius]|nr:polyglycerol phosphate synthase [Streptococcus infantarius subsp. infantarius]MCO4474755.1 polyglycerol phosphate synthase [Streptococcus infantarius subsp. infantarius]MCO4478230.1 polyglycerol phosphate synthase [Streptococcus infantarius subsp. infantarius]MCO4483695.1 polyglycerol phosphate synthase [Streptococcus infantarius subsp. infantarius]